jgi:ureidoacrylate peracid hydrolase
MSNALSREVEIEPAHTALLFVDIQNYNCLPTGGEYAQLDAAIRDERYGYFFRTLRDSALPNMVRLQQACRRARIEIAYTVIESLTADGRDR